MKILMKILRAVLYLSICHLCGGLTFEQELKSYNKLKITNSGLIKFNELISGFLIKS